MFEGEAEDRVVAGSSPALGTIIENFFFQGKGVRIPISHFLTLKFY
jgi:hypothetical protein